MNSRLLHPVSLGLAACGLLPLAAFAATLTGRVKLPPSPAAPVAAKRYEIVSKGGTLATYPPAAVVYLEGNFAPPDVETVVQVGQKDLMFAPGLLAIRVGTRVEFPNHDEVYHNIFSYSAPKRFDLGRYRADERPVPSQVFDTAGLVTLRCDIHDHMRGLILVLDTPHFVVTDSEGRFRLEGVPAGRYTLKAWVSSRKTLEKPLVVEGDETVSVDFP